MGALNQTADSLDAIEARIKQLSEGARDMSKCPVVEHKSTGLSFRVGSMGKQGYETWRNLVYIEDQQYEVSSGAKNNAPLHRKKSDAYLLENAVYTESGEKLSAAVVKYLIEGEGQGASTIQLLEAAVKENPPREALATEVQLLWLNRRCDLVLWDLLFSCGLQDVLMDKLSSLATPEEKAEAERKISKARETLFAFDAYFELKKAQDIVFEGANG